MDQFKALLTKYAKSAAAFLAALISNAAVDFSTGKVPWPTTQAEWVRYLATAVGVALAVRQVPNRQDAGQVKDSLEKLPDVQAEVAVKRAYPDWVVETR